MKVYRDIKKITDLREANELLNSMFALLAHNRKNYKAPINQIRQKNIKFISQDILTTESGLSMPLTLNYTDGTNFKLYVKNGSIGATGRQGKTGPEGDKGPNAEIDTKYSDKWLIIANDRITLDSSKVLSALQGVQMNEFIEALSETYLTEYQYALLYTDHVTIEAEFETYEDSQLVQLITYDPDSHQRYVKYWTFEADGEQEYFVLNHHLSTEDKKVYDSVYCDLWNDIYLGGTSGFFEATSGQLTDGSQLYIKNGDSTYTPIKQYNEDDAKNDPEYDLVYGERRFIYTLPYTNLPVDVKYTVADGYDFNLDAKESDLNIYIFDKLVDGKPTYKLVKKEDVDPKGNEVYYRKEGDEKNPTYNVISNVEEYIEKKATRYYKVNAEQWYEVDEITEEDKEKFVEYVVVDYSKTTNTSVFTRFYHVKTARDEYYSTKTDTLNPYTIIYYIEDNDRQYFTRYMTSKEVNGETIFDYNYVKITIPFWLEAEFYTGEEDQNIRLLSADTKYETDEEVETPIYVESIEIAEEFVKDNKKYIEIAKNLNENIEINIYPSNANQDELIFEYDDDAPIEFFEDGRIASIKNDDVTYEFPFKVFAEHDNDIFDEAIIKVVTPVEDIIFNKDQVNLYPGSSEQLEWSILPEKVSNNGVKFSLSRTDLINIDSRGFITPVRNSEGGYDVGSTTITVEAADGYGVKKTINVLVANPVQTVKITSNNFAFVDKIFSITTDVQPYDATEKTLVYYSSDPEIIEVGENSGTCTPKAVGKCTLYAKTTDGSDITASQEVNVSIGVDKITFSDFDIDSLEIGLSKTIGITVEPENAENKDIKIVVSDPSTIEYTEPILYLGMPNVYTTTITAIKNGSTQFSVQSVDGTNVVTSKDLDITIPMDSIDLGMTELIMYVGDEFKLIRPIIGPTDTSNTQLSWYSSEPEIATVDQQGRITPVSAGKARISVISADNNGVVASCEVTVKTHATSIELNNGDYDGIKILVNNYGFINAVVSPDNATDQILSWTSSKPEHVIVEDNGTIFGVSEGESIITATSVDGITNSIAVNVVNKIDENI